MIRPINDFFYKLSHWEYWPFGAVYFPVFIYWLWKSLKAGSLFFFSASNPAIETGGMLGESKWKILKNFPGQYIPKTIYFPAGTDAEIVFSELEESGIGFPLIAKPDVGERGRLVRKIHSREELAKYAQAIRISFLVQEYVDFPVELGIFYYRFPDSEKGCISSVVRKEFLRVEGDGASTVEQLIEQNPRSRFQKKRILRQGPHLAGRVLKKGELLELEPIGNHCRGTIFHDGCRYIDEKLTSVFDQLSRNIPGFYYGRFDLRCASVEDLKEGKNFRILELNGAGSEPAHIYDPALSILKAWKVLLEHWDVLYRISIRNKAKGVRYLTFREAVSKLIELRKIHESESFSR